MPAAILVLILALTFAAAPAFVTGFAGFDPALYPVPQVDPPVQPAGYAFAIWGLIYAWLIVHAGFGLWQRRADPAWAAVRWPLIGSLALGTAWLSVAVRSPLWATVMIFAMLVLALAALVRAPERPDRWLLLAPLAVYAGWLSAASFVSLGLLGAGYGVGPGATGWALISVAIATLLAAAVQLRLDRAPEYALAVAWALAAIVAKNVGTNLLVTLAAGLATLAMLALAVRAARRR